MNSAIIKGMGYYVPSNVVTNDDLATLMDTNNDWIVERTGINERRWIKDNSESTSSMALEASKNAIADAEIDKTEIDKYDEDDEYAEEDGSVVIDTNAEETSQPTNRVEQMVTSPE